jgi:hypothetical protein
MTLITTSKRRIALFLEGLSRATLIPYAPFLIALALNYHKDSHTHENQQDIILSLFTSTRAFIDSDNIQNITNETASSLLSLPSQPANVLYGHNVWSSISFYTSIMVITYILGSNIGYAFFGNCSKLTQYFYITTSSRPTRTATCSTINQKRNVTTHIHKCNQAYATIVGAILALQFFSFGVGYNHHIGKIWTIRFTMGIFNGFLQRISIGVSPSSTSSSSSSSSTTTTTTTLTTTGTNFIVFSLKSGLAKDWLLGFGLSALSSGIFYHHMHTSSFHSFFSNQEFSSWSWIVLVLIFGCVIFITQIIFQFGLVSITFDTTSSTTSKCYSFIDEEEDTMDSYDSIDSSHDFIGIGTGYSYNKNNNNASLVPSLKRRKNNAIAVQSNKSQFHITGDSQEDNIQLPQCNRVRLGSYNNQEHQNRVRLGSCQSNVSDVFFDCDQFDSFDASLSLDIELGGGDQESKYNNNNMVTLGSLTPSSSTTPQKIQKSKQKKLHSSWTTNANSITKYENGKCIFDDGSPSHVPAGCSYSEIPLAFRNFFQSQAQTKWEETKKWRKENKIYKIHTTPHRLFPRIKQAYPHFIHGYSKMGYPVVYEQPAKMKLKDMFKEGYDVDDMVHHYKFFLEYLSNVLSHQKPEIQQTLRNRPDSEANGDWGFVVVMDVSGISLSVFSGAVLQYLQKAGAVNNNHYPNTTTLGLLINAPFWLSGVFGKIKPLLPKSAKADLIGASSVTEGLRKYIDDDQIPKEFGGSSQYALDDHPYERELHALVGKSLEYNENEDIDQESDNDDEDEDDANVNDKDEDQFDLEACHHIQQSEMTNSLSHNIEPPMSPQQQPTVTFSDEYSPTSPISPKAAGAVRYSEVECTFFNISIIYWLLCAIQSSIEVAFPLWFLSPRNVGGLFYQPFRSGLCFFSCSIIIYLLLRSYQLKNVSLVLMKAPLKGFRIGMGSSAILLILMPMVQRSMNNEDMATFSIHTIICSSVFISIMIGRSSAARIHYIASCSYHDNLSISCDSRTRLGSIINVVCNFIRNGGLTWILGTSGEIFGALLSSQIIAWSYTNGKAYPCDATFTFHVGAALCLVLYIVSFTLKINGESLLCRHDHKRTLCSFIQVIISVSATDLKTILMNLSGRQPVSEESSKRQL